MTTDMTTTDARHTSWLDKGAQFSGGRVRNFGDPTAEFEVLATAGVVPLLGTGALRLTGDDRLEFLHGQVSNEVKRLQSGEGRAALRLNIRGHALALMRVYRRDDDLFVAPEGGSAEGLEAGLRAHIIFDQVEIENLSESLTALTLQGENAAETLQKVFDTELPAPDTFIQVPFASAKVLVSPVARSRAGGVDLHVLTRDAGALVEALQDAGAGLAGEDALEAHRIAAGLAGAAEGGEGVLPQEAGLTYAVSYRKGCYLGQEIMARIEARGKVRRQLVGLNLTALPEPGTRDVTQNGKTVGRLGGVAVHPYLGVIALGSVRSEIEAGEKLGVGGVTGVVSVLPLTD